MDTLVFYPKNQEQSDALKKVAKDFEISFEMKPEEMPYNPEFVAKIEQSRRDKAAGKGRIISMEELEASWK